MTQQNPQPKLVVNFDQRYREYGKYVSSMLEDFGLEGVFNLSFGLRDSNNGSGHTYGIRVKTHSSSGVTLVIQPTHNCESCSVFFLSWRGHAAGDLASALHQKLAGQKYYRLGEWRDPSKVIPMPLPVTQHTVPVDSTPVQSGTNEDRDDEERHVGYLKGYSKDPDSIALLIESIYKVHQDQWINFNQFHGVLLSLSDEATPMVSGNILRALIRKGVMKKEVTSVSELVCVTETGIRFAEVTFQAKIRQEAKVSIARQIELPAMSLKARIADLKVAAAKRKEAEQKYVQIVDQRKLADAEVTELENQIKSLVSQHQKAQQRCAELAVSEKELEEIVRDQTLVNAQNELDEIIKDLGL